MQTKHEQKADYTFSPLCKWNAIGAHKCNLIQILRVIVILLKNLWRCLILIIMKTTAKYSINASDQEENYRLKLVLQVLQKHMVKKIQQISFTPFIFRHTVQLTKQPTVLFYSESDMWCNSRRVKPHDDVDVPNYYTEICYIHA